MNKSIKELEEQAKLVSKEIAKMQIDLRIGKIKNWAIVGEKKKELARIKTLLTEKKFKNT